MTHLKSSILVNKVFLQWEVGNMHIKKINIRLRFLLPFILFLCGTSVSADELFKNIRAFDPGSIRQFRVEDHVRAMIVPGKTGEPSDQNISNTCTVNKPGELAGGVCCRNAYTTECRVADWQAKCDTEFVTDVFQDCNSNCDNPPKPSPSPSASPSRSPSPSKSPSPSRSPSAIPSTIQINRMVIEIQDSENAKPDYDNYANNSCVVQGGRKIANGKACEFETCSRTPDQFSFKGQVGILEGLRPSVLRRNFGCNSDQILTLCNWDCVGIDNATMQYGTIPPPPPPPASKTPVATRSAVVVRPGTPTPTRSSNPSLTRTPSRAASGTPRPSYSPIPSRTASAPRPTVTPSRSTATN